jgi:hypothetical protein
VGGVCLARPKKVTKSKTPNLDKILDSFTGDELAILEPREEYDSCIVGVVERFGFNSPVICYDREKVIQINVKDGMNQEEALEFYEFNTLGRWVGDGTYAFLSKLSE